MGFFTPWFFGGLLAVGLPLWVHLLRQHKSTPRPFASLMFFERRTQSSIKHRRLKHYALLALRLAMILLLVLLFANPFIRRMVPFGTGRKLVLVAVDRSFSMRYGDHLDRAKTEALNLVSNIHGADVGQIAAVSDRVELLTQPVRDRAALQAAIRSITPGDATSSFAEFTRFIRSLPKSSGLQVEAHFISDLQKSAIPASFADLALADRVTLQLHAIQDASEANAVVETVSAPDRIYGTKKATVRATVGQASGLRRASSPPESFAVALLINNKPIATQTAKLTNGRAEVEFQNVDMPYGPNRGEVRIQAGDKLPQDDHYYFSIERSDPAKVLYIHDARQSDTYYRDALESGAESAFDLDALAPAEAANVNLQRYAYVVLSGLNALPGNLEPNLKTYVANGGGLLIALGTGSAALGRVPVIDNRILDARYYTRDGDRFQTATDIDTTHPALDRANGLDGVKFYYAAKVDPGQDRILAKLSDGLPLILEHHLGEGRVLLVTSAFDNVTNDLPLHALFVPFVERLSNYLEGTESRQSNVTVGSAIELRRNKDRGAAADVVGPDGQRTLSLKEAASALAITARQEGFYDVRTATGRHELVAVNPDRRESDLTPIPEETLALWRGAGPTNAAAPVTTEQSEPVPQSLAMYVLLALIAVSIAESWLADRFTPATAESVRPETTRKVAA